MINTNEHGNRSMSVPSLSHGCISASTGHSRSQKKLLDIQGVAWAFTFPFRVKSAFIKKVVQLDFPDNTSRGALTKLLLRTYRFIMLRIEAAILLQKLKIKCNRWHKRNTTKFHPVYK